MSVQQLDLQSVTALVRDATAAPSMHNVQPWRFHFFPGHQAFQVLADPDRALPEEDPTLRALHLSCGAAIINLRVGAAHRNLGTDVRLLPEPSDPWLLAEVRLTSEHDPESGFNAGLAELHEQIPRRHTSRYPFAEKRVPDEIRDALREAARKEGARLTFPEPQHVKTILELVRDAEGRDSIRPGAAKEIARWARIGAAIADTAVDGIPEYAFGPRKTGGKAPMRDFAGREHLPGRADTSFEESVQLALLHTAGDERVDWLVAGQAMERVLLVATAAGLATTPTSQTLEWPDLRLYTREPDSFPGIVQMAMRLGYGPQGTGTPRRPVRDVLDIIG